MKTFLLSLSAVFLFISCSSDPAQKAANDIHKDSLLRHIETLSSDDFMGRGTGTEGEQMSVDYLVNELQEIGAQPAADDGSYVQEFPLLGQSTSNAEMSVSTNGRTPFNLRYFDEFMAWPANQSEEVDVSNAELIYVGYGIQAPEENWDDFKGTDVEGKILVVKNSDPAYDEDLFGGDARLYYGRYSYKYEKAKELGALGVLIIHTDETAGYGWNVVANSWSRERFYLKQGEDGSAGNTEFNGWLTQDASSLLFEEAGLNLMEQLEAADDPAFEPVPLEGLSMNVSMEAEYREIQSKNVIAKIEGNDPELKDEYLMLTAHFDHLGVTTPVEGDSINNGASDNAAGVAALLEMMEGYKELQPILKRSVLAVLVSAEEVGLLGSQYWAENPTVEPGKVTANINLDGMNVYGQTNDVVVVGYGRTSLSDLLEDEAQKQGRTVKPDPYPGRGYFYRSDHFNMAKVGIPAIFPNPGTEYVGKGENFLALRDSVADANYHTVNDEINEYWDLTGAQIDTRLFFMTGFRALNAENLQTWDSGDEFEATRLRMLERIEQ
ncbi:M20/M25/M40 family metallo-hydrolase [Gracilimonas mengyeensis]|uniref:Zn-dependent amino-or carboxypeptidase, M28 family n=1 Tax=Gracilimonas mengyeensis TaxID=1302730 RepID=A0A521DET2_9BACT|nr:M20/M25/M40 family metallo-hydrolase [Gracilimonas mengyeensis]SMO70108.1 Zn-dependent amino-or carboxypeptidase, M28 family [Gracilimonas mengyeensis]